MLADYCHSLYYYISCVYILIPLVAASIAIYCTLSWVITGFSGLLPFGDSAGDLSGPFGDDDASSPLTLTLPFRFYGVEYTRIIVSVLNSYIVNS